MADSQRRRRATVGQRRGVTWSQLLVVAIGAVGVGIISIFVVILSSIARDGGGGGGLVTISTSTPDPATPPQGNATPSDETPVVVTPEPSQDSPETVACGEMLAPLDKSHRLDANCVPGDLQNLPGDAVQGPQRMRAESAAALLELFDAASRDGFRLYAVSAYRSYEDQVSAYEANRQIYGDDVDRFSARPGHSEHQLGTTTDVSSASAGYMLEPFEGTPEAAWVAANSWRFGFIVSYPEGKEDITGYAYEPWHIRYVGKDIAADVRQSGQTLHEYLLAR